MVYKKGWYVALVGEASPDSGSEGGGDDLALWFAVCRQNVTDKTTQCRVEWLENVSISLIFFFKVKSFDFSQIP